MTDIVRRRASRFPQRRRWQAPEIRYTLGRMGRPKTISDDEVLRIARGLFRAHGHTATTRTIAQAAGISEAILYQRFGNKDDLFFAAMRPLAPDIEALLGPNDPPEHGLAYLRTVVVRIARYFAEVIPLALRVMTHPSFDPGALARAQPMGSAVLQHALAERLASLARRRRIVTPSSAVTARLLVSLAHDWALADVLAHQAAPRGAGALKEMVDVVWAGLRPRRAYAHGMNHS